MKIGLVLLAVSMVLTLTVCGGEVEPTPTPISTPTVVPKPSPTPNIEATVQARLKEERETKATVAPQVTVTAKPIPAPTATPKPEPTATPKPIPTPTPTGPPTATPIPIPTMGPTPTRIAATDGSGVPPFPNIFKGQVYMGGDNAPNNASIFARIGQYQTPTVLAADGKYSKLIVGPPSINFLKLMVTFHMTIGDVELQATETSSFNEVDLSTMPPQFLNNNLDLHFPAP